jgi:hypothetical protein
MHWDGERPAAYAELVEAESERLGSSLEQLGFVRLDANPVRAGFYWSQENTGLPVAQTRFPNRTELRSSVVDFYVANNATVPVPVFERSLRCSNGRSTPENATESR